MSEFDDCDSLAGMVGRQISRDRAAGKKFPVLWSGKIDGRHYRLEEEYKAYIKLYESADGKVWTQDGTFLQHSCGILGKILIAMSKKVKQQQLLRRKK